MARLIRGEIELRDFPWISYRERRSLGALGMSMLKSGRAEIAKAAFGVLVDFEPEVAIHHLMHGHACALLDDVQAAFRSFSGAISLSALDDDNQEVASEGFLARGDLLLRLGRTIEARADLADAAQRMSDPYRKRSIEAYLAA